MSNPTSQPLQRAVELLRAGELVAFPTETVYGLGADALNPTAVAKIFEAKGRPADHPLIVHLPDATHLAQWACDVPQAAHQLAAAFWPGPLTLILKRSHNVPDAVTGGQDSVGLRVPNHPLALALLSAFDGGIAAPSANRFGRISPTTAEHVREELADKVPLILDGGSCDVGIESTILDLSRGRAVLLRPGAISVADIERVIGQQVELPNQDNDDQENDEKTPRVSGALAAHYAPRTPLQLVASDALEQTVSAASIAGKKVAVLARRPPQEVTCTLWRVAPPDATHYAHHLYASLRELDHAGCDLIVIESPPIAEDWRAIVDRLHRAACGSGKD